MSHFVKKVKISPQINQLLKDELKEEKNVAVDPPQEKIAELFNLYNLEKYEELLHESKFLIDFFRPRFFSICLHVSSNFKGLKLVLISITIFKNFGFLGLGHDILS